MVIYDLICPQGHQFEGWFPGYEAFKKQLQEGLIACHICGDVHITKVISGGHFMGSRKQEPSAKRKEPTPTSSAEDSVMAASGKIDAVTFIKAVRHYVTQNFEDVGDRFPQLIREMHGGKREERNIYGRITPEQQEELAENDIPHILLPDLPPEFEN